MRQIATAFGFCLAGLLVIVYFDNRQEMQHATHKVVNGVANGLIFALWSAIALGIIAVLVILYIAYTRQYRADHNRVIDGSHELREYRIRRRWGIFGGVRVLVDPSLMESAVAYISNDGYAEGPQVREPVRIETQRTRHLNAIHPGDAVWAAQREPRMVEQLRAASNKVIAAKPAPTPKAAPMLPAPVEDVAPVTRRYDLLDALTLSTSNNWIVGQAADGKLAAFNPLTHAHVGVVGATGTGKTTSVGYTLALQALSQKYHVVIFDPPGGEDWSRFAKHVEYHETDRTTFLAQVSSLYQLFESRTDGARSQPIFGIIEEYGDLIRQMRTVNRADADEVDAMIDTLLRRGRKRNIHLCFIDQYPEHWSQQVIGGTKFRSVFQLGPNQGAKVEEYKAGQLPDVGEFLVRGQQYHSWNAKPEVADLLSVVPVRQSSNIIDGTYSVVSVRPSATVSGGGSTSVADSQADTVADTMTDSQQRIIDYYAANPDAGVREAARVLGLSKSYVSDVRRTMIDAVEDAPTPVQQTDVFGRAQTIIDAGDPNNADIMAEIRQALQTGQVAVKGRKAA